MTSEQKRLLIANSIISALGIAVFAAVVVKAEGHEAPTGWEYPYACCSDRDCRQVHDASVGEGPRGYTIKATGEVLAYTDKRVKNSPDGLFHWCSLAGKEDSRTICLFVPPRSF